MHTGNNPKVSIIIPLHIISDRFFYDLHAFDRLVYKKYEVLIVSDKKIQLPKIKHIRIITTGSKYTGPAEKRDIGIDHAKGSILAFIDDDAYPDPHWVTTAVHHFVRNKDVIAVGGPGVTPPDDAKMAKLGGLIYESEYTSGQLKFRFTPVGERPREILDWPAFNLFFRKNILKKVGGWGSNFYGGEDTYICLKMLSYGRIIYDPKTIVYHHRRPLYLPHLKQVFNVGAHRGFFFKKYPETSRKLLYLLPTTLTLGFWTFMIASFFSPIVLGIFLLSFGIFYGMAFSTMCNKTDFVSALIGSSGILLTHMAYGVGFVKGLLSEKLER